MKKLISLSLIVVFGLAIALTSCKKYPDGPVFSLASKKSRVVNVWKIQKVLENAVDVTSQYIIFLPDYTFEFKKDYSYIISSTGFSSAETGTWTFDTDKTNLIITPNGGSSAYKEEILRLKSSELWLKETDGNNVTEIHYVSK